MTTASSCGMAPPASDVPAPRGTTFTPSRAQQARTAATSSVRARQGDGQRHPAMGGERVGFEGAALVLGGDETIGGSDAREAGDDVVAAGEDSWIGNRKGDAHDGDPPPSFRRRRS